MLSYIHARQILYLIKAALFCPDPLKIAIIDHFTHGQLIEWSQMHLPIFSTFGHYCYATIFSIKRHCIWWTLYVSIKRQQKHHKINQYWWHCTFPYWKIEPPPPPPQRTQVLMFSLSHSQHAPCDLHLWCSWSQGLRTPLEVEFIGGVNTGKSGGRGEW